MAHMIDTTTGNAAIAYSGLAPWHKLGQQLTAGATIQEWTQQAGLAYDVLESPVLFNTPATSAPQAWPDRKVLHRSDTGAPLAVVSQGYNVVQPAEVMGFFSKLVDLGGFTMETAGALSYGRRVWALAKVNEGADIVEGDTVRPYVLLGTSYDGTMATIAKFTSVRVVCNNTITAAAAVIVLLHTTRTLVNFAIVANQWERFLVQSRKLAGETMTGEECDAFVTELLKPYHTGKIEIKDSRAFKRIIELFNGRAIGSDIVGVAGTRWAALNAVTELVDHERGRSDNTRIESAWFGTGAALKNRALELLSA